ncbi:hypothetical protein JXM67_08860 [candidate division WOR-3 bacterium]|nr:hypothetical protein [candidate division WOR-3 bacterium]
MSNHVVMIYRSRERGEAARAVIDLARPPDLNGITGKCFCGKRAINLHMTGSSGKDCLRLAGS